MWPFRTVDLIHFHLTKMEARLMSRISDAVDAITSAIDELSVDVANEIQQLKDAIAAGSSADADAAADRVMTLVDKVKAASDALKADDPAPPTV